MSKRTRTERRLLVDLGIGLSVIAVLALPALLNTRAFFGDWGHHLYLVDQQTQWLRHHLFPTFFVHSAESGIFYPHYMFYGGTLYTITGWLGVVFGSSLWAYRVTFIVAFAACYFGILWTARQLGIRSLLAHIPATLGVSGAYYLSKAYYDGGWPEFVAISMIPLVVAAAVSIVRSRKVPFRAGALLVASTLLLTGSHSITLLYGSLFLATVAVVALVVYRRAITRRIVKRFAIVGALASLAAAMNGWFLVPLARYASATAMNDEDPTQRFHRFDDLNSAFSSWRVIFHPLRTYPRLPIPNATPFYVQVPVYALLWLICLGVFLLIRRERSRKVAMFCALIVLVGALLTLILWQPIWDGMPDLLKVIQFRYRLHIYVIYTVVGLVILGLLVLARMPKARAWILTLGLATAMSLGLAIWQAWSVPTYLPVSQILKTGTHVPPIAVANCPVPCPLVYTDYRFPGDTPAPETPLSLDIASARKGTVEARVPNGGPYLTNVTWSPVIEATGDARIIGATKDDGWSVIEPTPRAGVQAGAVPVRIQPRTTSAILAGRVVSISAVAMLLIWLAVASTHRVRVRRRRPGNSSGAFYRA